VISYRVYGLPAVCVQNQDVENRISVMQLKVIQDCKGPANSRGLESLLVSAEVFIVHSRFTV